MQDRDAARELAQRGVGACQALGEGGTCGNIVVDELEDLLEQLDSERRVAASVGDVAETLECTCPLGGSAGVLERLFEQARSLLRLVESQRDLGIRKRRKWRELGTGREILLAHVEPVCELAQDLRGGDSRAGLDARDVGGRAAGPGELSLAQTGALSRLP